MNTTKLEKLNAELSRYNTELEEVEQSIRDHVPDGTQSVYPLLRLRSSLQGAINFTELELAGRLEWTGVVGGLATGFIVHPA